ncbi:hypothetical protein [Virgibacillus sp. JSM 102003]|uniref:hypothetical protein n=1 Tax=Virgibacillus sp. JSM 102003 TaxID=1562108 RepID=UPI0035C0A7B1
MKKQDQNELKDLLKDMPKPDVSKQKRTEIHHAIMNSNKSFPFKKFTAIFGAVAAGCLFFLLIFSFINTNNQQAAIHTYNDIVKGEVSAIKGATEDSLYSSSDQKIIDNFHETIGAMDYKKTTQESSVFEKTITLYNNDNDKVTTMTFTGENIVTIDGKQYKIDENQLNQFTSQFFTEKYKTNTEKKPSLKEQANKVLTLLTNENMEALANQVHSEKGLLFSPYVYVKSSTVTFSQNEITKLLEDNNVYEWGSQDGSGKPIKLTPSEYFDEYVNASYFSNADEVNVNNLKNRGTMLNNIREVFPKAQTVEFYQNGKEELAWESLTLVFEDVDGSRKLVAIVHGEWTS